jgi:hypothetical protein
MIKRHKAWFRTVLFILVITGCAQPQVTTTSRFDSKEEVLRQIKIPEFADRFLSSGGRRTCDAYS